MATFKKSECIQGKWKSLQCTEEGFVDTETGEEVDVHSILLKQFGLIPTLLLLRHIRKMQILSDKAVIAWNGIDQKTNQKNIY